MSRVFRHVHGVEVKTMHVRVAFHTNSHTKLPVNRKPARL